MTAASTKADVMATLCSANADHVKAAAEVMANQCQNVTFAFGDDVVRQVYADAGAVAALVAAMATHGAHPDAQEQLCRAIKEQAALSGANQAWGIVRFVAFSNNTRRCFLHFFTVCRLL